MSTPHLGDTVPTHRAGHCTFDVTLTGRQLCNAPATWHVWIGPPDGNDGTVFACDRHANDAHELLKPTDWHPVESPCLNPHPHLWKFSDGDRYGWCYDVADPDQAVTVALDVDTPVSTLAGGVS